jgi:hypothetical protein
MKLRPLRCIICRMEIEPDLTGYAGGHNAEPVRRGRCCEECNWTVVVPTRFSRLAAAFASSQGDEPAPPHTPPCPD